MRTPPPAVPGIADANSKPPRPAARARWRQTAFVAPPPATSTSPSTSRGGELARELQHERVDAVVVHEQVRAEADRLDGAALAPAPSASAACSSSSVSGFANQRAGPPVPIVV